MMTNFTELIYLLLKNFDLDELVNITKGMIKTSYFSLDGPTSQVVVRLITALESQGKLPEFVEEVQKRRPDLNIKITPEIKASTGDLIDIGGELQTLKKQLIELRESSINADKLEDKLTEIIETTDQALGKNESLTARLILPSADLTDVRLVPLHTLDRIEEYRSDENIAFLLIGMFGGSILGILSNWATTENFSVSRFSIVLIILLGVLTVACIIWAVLITRRANRVKSKMLENSSPIESKQSKV